MVSLMTALWFTVLEAPDRVSVKPHASPVLHAINYLLGRLDRSYLTTLRQFGGLQSYPSRTKDPDPVDYSTGSVGLGATAPIWGALAHRYVAGHFDVPVGGRQIALIGDAELDEGACWEAIADPMVSKLGEVMWVVDLNRQSLDRVVPDIAAGRLAAMFEAAGWHVEMVKYGPQLAAAPRAARADRRDAERGVPAAAAGGGAGAAHAPGGRRAAGGRPRAAGRAARPRRARPRRARLARFRAADGVRDRPSIVFAYTIKGWRLPTEGHPANHSALLSGEQFTELAATLGADPEDPWAPFDPGSAAAELCASAARRLRARAGRAGRAARRARHARARAPRQRVHAAGVRALLGRSRARGARGGGPRRHRLARRRHLDEPRRLDQQGRDLSPSATASTGSPTTPTRSCAGARPTTGSTSSSGSPRSTSSACSASWARPGRATASRCCRSARSTTRSWRARSSRGRSGSTPAASRSWSARRAA